MLAPLGLTSTNQFDHATGKLLPKGRNLQQYKNNKK